MIWCAARYSNLWMEATTTLRLHEDADRAEAAKDSEGMLRAAAEILRVSPGDDEARLKAARALASLGRADDAVKALRTAAAALTGRGYALTAIAAYRDILNLRPKDPGALAGLAEVHASIAGVEPPARARVPPPNPPRPVTDTRGKDSMLPVKDVDELCRRAAALAAEPGEPASILPRAGVPLFSEMSKDAFVGLVTSLDHKRVPAGEAIVKEGEIGSSMFVVIRGELEVSRTRKEERLALARLVAGSVFGEMSLITANPRTATVTALTPVEVFEIGVQAIEAVAQSSPTITQDLVQFARRRMLMNLLATSAIFKPFTPDQRKELLRSFASRVVAEGDVVIKEGAEPTGLYLVASGQVEIAKNDADGDRLVLAKLAEGDVFGEIALIDARLTTATVTALQKSVLLFLDRNRFKTLVEKHPALEAYLANLSEDRLKEIEAAMRVEDAGLLLI